MDILLQNSCKYCLQEGEEQLLTPCLCKGSVGYVHNSCLIKWFEQRRNSIVIPGNFSQYEFECEICKYKYNTVYDAENNQNCCFPVCFYITAITSLLISSYILLGWALESNTFLFIDQNNKLQNIFINGFILTHIILGIFYLIIIIYSGSRREIACLCCCNFTDNSDCFICLVFLLIIGILGTILVVYYDVVSRVIQREHNKTIKLIRILPHQENSI
jgi:RING-variant domain